jgi:hypothetical protein
LRAQSVAVRDKILSGKHLTMYLWPSMVTIRIICPLRPSSANATLWI